MLGRDALDLGSSVPSTPAADPAFKRPEELAELTPRTPSHWTPSSRGSPQADVAFLDDDDNDDDEGENPLDTDAVRSPAVSPPASPINCSRMSLLGQQQSGASKRKLTRPPTPPIYKPAMIPVPTSSYLSAPTPAQRPRIISSSSPLPPASAAQEVSISAVYESPMPAPPSSALPFSSFHLTNQRRVPRPICHRLSPDPNIPGPGRILVPNSDTSASLSQDRPFSQQVGSQLPSQQVGSSQVRTQRTSPSQSQGKSQEQNQQEARSQQSLSYASESQNSKSDPKSQGSKQSQLRNEVIAPEETDEVQSVPNAHTADEATRAEPAPRVTDEAELSVPARVLSPDTPDSRAASLEAEATKGQGSPRQSASPPGSASEVAVDSESETEDESEAEEEEDYTSDEQDELESVPSRRAPVLDSDDERTEAMVSKYNSRSVVESAHQESRKHQTTDLVPGAPQKENGSTTRRRPLRKNGSTTSLVNSEMPLPPSSPDVFSSDASFHASEGSSPLRVIIRSNKALLARTKSGSPATPVRDPRQLGFARGRAADTGSSDRTRVERPPQPTHDPEAWKVPAFLRKLTPAQQDAPAQKPQAVVATKERVQRVKRVISISSDSEAEGPPTKKQKISTAAATRTSGWVQTIAQTLRPQQTKGITLARRPTASKLHAPPDGRPAPPAGLVKQFDLRRSASLVSSAHPVPKQRHDAGRSASPEKRGISGPEVKVVRQLSPGGSTPVEVKHVDFAPGTRRSLSILATKTRMTEASGLHSLPPAIHRGQASSSEQRTLPADGRPSANRAMQPPATSNKESAQSSTDRRQRHSVASSSTSGSAGLAKETGQAPQAERRLLGGYEIDFNECYTENGPQFVTWHRLRQILLNTGRAKHKLKVQQGEGSDRPLTRF